MAYRYPGASPDTIKITRVTYCPTKFAIHDRSTSNPESEYC